MKLNKQKFIEKMQIAKSHCAAHADPRKITHEGVVAAVQEFVAKGGEIRKISVKDGREISNLDDETVRNDWFLNFQ